MTKDYRGLSTHDFVERTRHEAEAILKKRKPNLKMLVSMRDPQHGTKL